MKRHPFQVPHSIIFAAGAALAAGAAQADVTVEQRTTLDVASVIRMHGTTTTSIAADKKRDDTESHCEGVMSLVCGNLHGGEIVRLDKGLTWHLRPDKKTYSEDMFATPEQLADMRARMQATLEKMRSCPVPQRQEPVDKSKCEMSPPKIDVHATGEKMTIAGHDAQRTVATLTETCTNKDTGDVCDTVVAFDLWLTQDKLPGAGDRRAFEQAYAKKLGIEDAQGAMRGEFARYLAPYQSQIKELTAKSADLKGMPLKTSLRVMMGGQQCAAAAKTKAGASSGDGSSVSANPMNNVAQAGKAIGASVGNLVGGLFHKKKTDGSQAPASSASPAAVEAPAPDGSAGTAIPADPFAQYLQMASFTIETAAINTDPVAADRFEVPADWKKDLPKAAAKDSEEYTCPKTGT